MKRKEGGTLATLLHISSMKTFVTNLSCNALRCSSSGDAVLAGSSSRSSSSAESISRFRTPCSVVFKYCAPFHLANTESILVATQLRLRSSDSLSIQRTSLISIPEGDTHGILTYPYWQPPVLSAPSTR